MDTTYHRGWGHDGGDIGARLLVGGLRYSCLTVCTLYSSRVNHLAVHRTARTPDRSHARQASASLTAAARTPLAPHALGVVRGMHQTAILLYFNGREECNRNLINTKAEPPKMKERGRQPVKSP